MAKIEYVEDELIQPTKITSITLSLNILRVVCLIFFLLGLIVGATIY